MGKRPSADMDSLTVSKGQAAAVEPFAAPVVTPAVPAVPATLGASKGLTIKLDAPLYAALRDYCYQQERATRTRVTHQAVMVQALQELLERHKA